MVHSIFQTGTRSFLIRWSYWKSPLTFSRAQLIMFRYPACWLPAFWFAWTFSWSVGIGTIITILFRRNYHLIAPNVNLIYLSPLIGAVLGELAGGPLSDFVVRRLTRRNHSQRRPEMRLHAMYPALVCIIVGLVVFGVTLQQQRHYIM